MKTRVEPRQRASWLVLETVIIIGLSCKLILTGLFLTLVPGSSGSFLETRPAMAQDQAGRQSEGAAGENLPAANPPTTEKGGQMIQSLKTKEDALNRKEERLNEREKALETLEKDLRERLAALEATRKELTELVKKQEALIQEQKILKNARIEHLVAAYKSMRPEKAGTLVNSLDDEVAVKILSSMPGRNAGQILSFVEPDKAARLTKAISTLLKTAPPPEEEPAGQPGPEEAVQDQSQSR